MMLWPGQGRVKSSREVKNPTEWPGSSALQTGPARNSGRRAVRRSPVALCSLNTRRHMGFCWGFFWYCFGIFRGRAFAAFCRTTGVLLPIV